MKDCVIFLIITVLCVVYYLKKLSTTQCYWVETDQESLLWKIHSLRFSFFDQSHKPYIFKPNSRMITYISDYKKDMYLDIYDEKNNPLFHFCNPKVICLEEGKEVFSGIKYFFYIRNNSEDPFKISTLVQEKPKKPIKPIYDIREKYFINEKNIQLESKQMMKKVMLEMRKKNMRIEKIVYSELSRSFPTELLTSTLEIELEPYQHAVVIVSNKNRTSGIDDQIIEVSSVSVEEEKEFLWKPVGDKNFSVLNLLNEEEESVEIFLKEYLHCGGGSLLVPLISVIFSETPPIPSADPQNVISV